MPSPLKNSFLSSPMNVLVGQARAPAPAAVCRRRAHPLEHVVVRDDLRALRGVLDVAGDVAAGDRAAGLADVLVAADVIGVDVRVDDVADRSARQRADRRQNLVRQRRVLRVDDEHAVLADLDGDVAAGADQHVDVALRRQHLDLDGVEVLRLLPAAARRATSAHERHDRQRSHEVEREHARSIVIVCASWFSWLHRPDLLPVLGIHRLGAASGRFGRHAVGRRDTRRGTGSCRAGGAGCRPSAG